MIQIIEVLTFIEHCVSPSTQILFITWVFKTQTLKNCIPFFFCLPTSWVKHQLELWLILKINVIHRIHNFCIFPSC